MRSPTIIISLLTIAGFALRLRYITSTHPFFDEYTTVLAARQILRTGWPVLPSALFYEHGLLATYIAAPFTALFINTPPSQWQPAQWGLMPARWPSLLVSTATIPLIYAVGRELGATVHIAKPHLQSSNRSKSVTSKLSMQNNVGFLAAAFFALSPEGMVWGGRARMYALATFLVLLTVYWAYKGVIYPAAAKHRWLALAVLFAALLTQFGVLMLIPPLVVAMVAIGWLSHNGAMPQNGNLALVSSSQKSRTLWFFRKSVLSEALALLLIIALAISVKRLGQPLGSPALLETAAGSVLTELINTVAYQTAFYFTWADTVKFLTRQFGVSHHFWLTIVAIAGVLIAWASVVFSRRGANKKQSPLPLFFGNLFLWIIFGLIIVQMVTLLQPFRRNPRYMVMYLPLFYLVAANSIVYLLSGIGYLWQKQVSRSTDITPTAPGLLSMLALLLLVVWIGFSDLRIALVTPEPAYEEAFAHVLSNWQPGDTLLTMNTPAAELYLGGVNGFTVQNDAEQFLLNADTEPVDRWLGSPWIGNAATFHAALNSGNRVWFVIDTIRLPVYFRGDWQAVVNTQMEPVWAVDNALVYRSRPNRVPLPTQPDTPLKAMLGESIRLAGYSLDDSQLVENSQLGLTLFWQPLAVVPHNYTLFLHLRNSNGVTVAQRDAQPLEGVYPTSQWQPNETVIDPVTLSLPQDLPPGSYRLLAGLYRLDTLERLPVATDISGENAVLLGEVVINE